jgi:hypothetical protein
MLATCDELKEEGYHCNNGRRFSMLRKVYLWEDHRILSSLREGKPKAKPQEIWDALVADFGEDVTVIDIIDGCWQVDTWGYIACKNTINYFKGQKDAN